MKATIDTNIIGHLYRSKTIHLITNLFEEIFVDEFIIQELQRRCKDIFADFMKDLEDPFTPFTLVDKTYLIQNSLLQLYNIQLNDLQYLFLPSDEGERRAIALAQTTGTYFLLTDDEKSMDGPYHMISRGLVNNMESLAFWDLIFLNATRQLITFDLAKENFEAICLDGYLPDSYKGEFKSKLGHSIRRLKDKTWFKDQIESGIIQKRTISYFIKFIQSIK
ncbi:hypothetical protein P4V34_28865 [Bacillus thuringiensis]|nr:hypothetical protein [Bacillus thuringiensis]